jgi:S1-C subfamily serine protease
VQSRIIITAIDGAPVADASAFAKIIDSHTVGDTIALTAARAGQAIQLRATLAERPTS